MGGGKPQVFGDSLSYRTKSETETAFDFVRLFGSNWPNLQLKLKVRGGLKWCKTDSAYIRHSIGDWKQKDWDEKVQTAWFGKRSNKETAFDLEA